jgi:hypothetical protein
MSKRQRLSLKQKVDLELAELEKSARASEVLAAGSFEEIKNKIDEYSNDLIKKINECSENLIAEIDEYEAECYKNAGNLKIDSISSIENCLELYEKKSVDSSEASEIIHRKSKRFLDRIKKSSKQLQRQIFICEPKKFDFDIKYLYVECAFIQHTFDREISN